MKKIHSFLLGIIVVSVSINSFAMKRMTGDNPTDQDNNNQVIVPDAGPITQLPGELVNLIIAFLPDVLSFQSLAQVNKFFNKYCIGLPALNFECINLSDARLNSNDHLIKLFESAIYIAIKTEQPKDLERLLKNLKPATLKELAKYLFELSLDSKSNDLTKLIIAKPDCFNVINNQTYVLDLLRNYVSSHNASRLGALLAPENKVVVHITEGMKNKCLWHCSEQSVALVAVLLKNGTNINHLMDGSSPLFRAARSGHLPVVKLLLKKGADKEIPCDGLTPLYIASKKGHVEVVKALLTHGADKEAANEDGTTPLYIASKKGHVQVVEVLLTHGADKEASNEYGLTPLYIASIKGHFQVVEALLKHDANKEDPKSLVRASEEGHLRVVELFLKYGAHVNGTIVTFVIERGKIQEETVTSLDMARIMEHTEIAELLTQYGGVCKLKH